MSKSEGSCVPFEMVTLVGGQKILAHPPSACEGRPCCIHNPSDHHMEDWPQNWRDDTGVMERLCSCGTGHPDPDHLAYVRTLLPAGARNYDAIHGCCGHCCPPGESSGQT